MAGNGKPGWLPVIEDGHTLDLAHLRRKGLLVVDGVQRTATIQWHFGVSRAPTLEVAMTCFATPEYGWLELRYKLPKSDGSSIDMHERIHLLLIEEAGKGLEDVAAGRVQDARAALQKIKRRRAA